MEIVVPDEEQAAAICDVVRRSIIELCVEDHHGDPEVLGRWLDSKTPERVRAWVSNPANRMLIAVEHGQVLGAGCLTTGGEITLNYVSPDARFRGVSRALVEALEARARADGQSRVVLDSTTTARRFYLGRGYTQREEETTKFGLTTWPMIKVL